MKIDPKDLIPLQLPIKPGAVFYRKEEGENEYSRCVFFREELQDPAIAVALERMTKIFLNEGRLFISRNRPWQSITR